MTTFTIPGCVPQTMITFKLRYQMAYQFHQQTVHQLNNCSVSQSKIYRRGNVENGWKSLIMVDHAWKCQ